MKRIANTMPALSFRQAFQCTLFTKVIPIHNINGRYHIIQWSGYTLQNLYTVIADVCIIANMYIATNIATNITQTLTTLNSCISHYCCLESTYVWASTLEQTVHVHKKFASNNQLHKPAFFKCVTMHSPTHLYI